MIATRLLTTLVLLAGLLSSLPVKAKPQPPTPSPTQRTTQGSLHTWYTAMQPFFAQIRLFQTYGNPTVSVRVKLVYAYTSENKHLDPALRKDIPTLGLYDFNSYKLLQQKNHQIAYKQDIHVQVNPRYAIQLTPQTYDKQQRKISIRATFLRLRVKPPQTKRYVSYATTLFRLQNGGKIALMGPIHKNGRAMLILHAAHQP